MDKESLTLIINNYTKQNFENSVKVVLENVFRFQAENIENISVRKGENNTNQPILYYLQLNNTDSIDSSTIKKKIVLCHTNRLFIFYKFATISESEIKRREIQLFTEYNINVTCINTITLADLIISGNLENKLFTDDSLNQLKNTDDDYLSAAFHSLTIASSDVSSLKGKVYDDAIMFKVADGQYTDRDILADDVISFMQLNKDKRGIILKRIDSLFSRCEIVKSTYFILSSSSSDEIDIRKKAYIQELTSLSTALIDLLRSEYQIDWNIDDTKKISTLLAFSAIDNQIRNLRDAKTEINHTFLSMTKGSVGKIIAYLKGKGLEEAEAQKVFENIADIASKHPLIIKITRACIYMALEGSNPLSSAQALGAKNWKDFNVMLEPTVAIPYICHQLYNKTIINSFEKSITSVQRAIELTKKVSIPHSYINECAGHLLTARKYDGIELDSDEMAHSKNAFVSYYHSLLKSGVKLPDTFLEYLATFSPAIKSEKSNLKIWIREIMTDLSSILITGKVKFEDTKFYNDEELKQYEDAYSNFLSESNKQKPGLLISHDSIALKHTNDKIINDNDHWIILSYDSILSKVGNQSFYKGWVCNPEKFLDMTNITTPLSETQMVSVVHSVASFSERTLAIGARIMDRIVQYASREMQNWEFKQDIDSFKQNMKDLLKGDDYEEELVSRTDKFLKEKGISFDENEETEVPPDFS